jgi:hypothetical protein
VIDAGLLAGHAADFKGKIEASFGYGNQILILNGGPIGASS